MSRLITRLGGEVRVKPDSVEACHESLTAEPLPLYSDPLDVAVLWNAKAGCTFAIKWLYYQEGLLDEALAYSTWPHEYRQQVYCRRPAYSDKVLRIPSMGARAIKFVRDPFDRVVSAYLAYSQQAHDPANPPLTPILRGTTRRAGRFVRDPFGPTRGPLRSDARRIYTWIRRQHTPMLRAIGRHVGRPVGNGKGFSFREFVDVLASLDLDRANPHVRRQISACERHGHLPDLTILRIEESAERLPQIEAALDLPPADLDRLRESRHHTTRVVLDEFVGDHHFGRTLGVALPRSRSFYDDALSAQVRHLYAEDLAAYGYPTP